MKNLNLFAISRSKISLLVLVAGLSFCVALAQPAQVQGFTTPAQSAKSSEILGKVHQLQLLHSILPLNFTKKELDGILGEIDKARDQVKKTEVNEYNLIILDEDAVNAAIDAGLNKDVVPDQKLMASLASKYETMNITRQIMVRANIDLVYEEVKKDCDDGQLSYMANNGGAPTDPKADKEAKIREFVSDVLLDPLAYPILIKLDSKPS